MFDKLYNIYLKIFLGFKWHVLHHTESKWTCSSHVTNFMLYFPAVSTFLFFLFLSKRLNHTGNIPNIHLNYLYCILISLFIFCHINLLLLIHRYWPNTESSYIIGIIIAQRFHHKTKWRKPISLFNEKKSSIINAVL